jgi:arginase family enzyme
MHVQVLNFDGSLLAQEQLLQSQRPDLIDLGTWGPHLRMACSFKRFRQLERVLERLLRRVDGPSLTFLGSGDFHHVTLAMLRRISEPFVLLMFDNHPDWMRGIPFLHCGTWVRHALDLPNLQQVLHIGGNTDFDNWWRLLAPSREIQAGKIVVAPGARTFRGGFWNGVPHDALRRPGRDRLTEADLDFWTTRLTPYLAGRAVYVTFDKDVLVEKDAVINWDSGVLRIGEVLEMMARLFEQSRARLVGMDVIGDWSPVKVEGLLRKTLHVTEHPSQKVDPEHACRVNEEANLCVADFVRNLDRISDDNSPRPTPVKAA